MQQSAKQELALLPGGLHFSLRIPHFMFSPTPAYYPGFGIFVRLVNLHIFLFLVFRHASVSSTYPGPGQSVSHTFGLPFCQRLWALTKHRDDKEADKVADIMAGHRCWLIGSKFFRPKAYPNCVSLKLCEFRLNSFLILTNIIMMSGQFRTLSIFYHVFVGCCAFDFF